MKKMFNEGNQIHNFMSSAGSGTVINYGSGSTSQKVMVPMVPVPVPQHCHQHKQILYVSHHAYIFLNYIKTRKMIRLYSLIIFPSKLHLLVRRIPHINVF